MNQLISTLNLLSALKLRISFVGRSVWEKKITIFVKLDQSWNVSTKCWQKNSFFYQQSQPLHDVIQLEFQNLEFLQGFNFELLGFLEKIGTNYLFVSETPFEDICPS